MQALKANNCLFSVHRTSVHQVGCFQLFTKTYFKQLHWSVTWM